MAKVRNYGKYTRLFRKYITRIFCVIQVVATETFDSTHIGRLNFDIELINWNDELPIFEKADYEVNIDETTAKDVEIIQILATDRDIGDKVM